VLNINIGYLVEDSCKLHININISNIGMSIIDFIKTPTGKIFASIILAIGLASIVRMSCKSANIIIVQGPPIQEIQDKIFSFDSKCYSYKKVVTSCKNLEDNKTNLN
jgi:hypothetical protein